MASHSYNFHGKPVLVTGVAAFLGSHLCERLLEEGVEFLSIDNYFTARRTNRAHRCLPLYISEKLQQRGGGGMSIRTS
jgi:nucleoside-diphosphate-sugar epimerase